MNKEEMIDNINDEDFIIRIRPFADEDGQWNGEIDISIMAFPKNPMDDEDYGNVMHFVKMMCATVPIMEQEESIRNVVHEYVTNVIDNELEVDVELEEEMGVEKEYDGNVVHLTFNTKTGGNA
tara:strand:- start:21 stop:389 length:369 start_codon:yes stop_codon:yes gene_type:complete